MTTTRGLALGIRTADCLPIIALDPAVPVLATVHAGWRGTAGGVLAATLEKMVSGYGALAERIRVVVGPGARACCYEVGPDVTKSFDPAALVEQETGSVHLDLVAANRQQATDAGVDTEHFEAVATCSICSPGNCHSYRRDGESAGRMWLIAALKPEPGD